MIAAAATAEDSTPGPLDDAIKAKLRWRVFVPFALLVLFSSLDRVAIGFAANEMNPALGLTPQGYGFAAGIFFAGYLLFQFPSAALHRRLGTRRWLTAIMLFWGACATATAFVQDLTSLCVLRFLLGAGEAGLTPGILLYSNTWVSKRHRAGAIAVTLLAVPTSVIFGGPFSGWLMSSGSAVGIAGWRWMFLVEGIATMLIALAAYRWFAQTPDRAAWLTADERDELMAQLAAERGTAGPVESPPWRTLLGDNRLWRAASVWLALLLGSNGLVFWLPQVLKQASGAGNVLIGVMSAVPWVGIGLGMYCNARHSDRTRERRRHIAVPALLGAAALVAASLAGPGVAALACLFVAGLGIGAAQGVFWALPAEITPAGATANGITLMNLIGNTSSLVGPWLIGLLLQRTGSFDAPIYFVAAALAFGAAMVLSLRPRP